MATLVAALQAPACTPGLKRGVSERVKLTVVPMDLLVPIETPGTSDANNPWIRRVSPRAVALPTPHIIAAPTLLCEGATGTVADPLRAILCKGCATGTVADPLRALVCKEGPAGTVADPLRAVAPPCTLLIEIGLAGPTGRVADPLR